MSTEEDTCDDLGCWLESVARHPMLIVHFCRWLVRHGMKSHADVLAGEGPVQQAAYCESWAKLLEV